MQILFSGLVFVLKSFGLVWYLCSQVLDWPGGCSEGEKEYPYQSE